jgi:hypothetical protein
MSQKHQSGQRLLCAAGITLALLGLASQSAFAQEAVQSSDSLTVVRDAETGKIRSATAEEQAALKTQASSKLRALRVAPAPAMLEKFHAKGARGMRMTDEMISSAVAVRKADGSIEMQCVDSHGGNADTTGHVHTNKAETE